MKKKELSSEERQFDATLRTAIMRLGPNPEVHDQPIPFPYVLVWDRLGRKGQACKILRQSSRTAQIKFEGDGFTTVIDRQALRRI
jgi:hypothetical protein